MSHYEPHELDELARLRVAAVSQLIAEDPLFAGLPRDSSPTWLAHQSRPAYFSGAPGLQLPRLDEISDDGSPGTPTTDVGLSATRIAAACARVLGQHSYTAATDGGDENPLEEAVRLAQYEGTLGLIEAAFLVDRRPAREALEQIEGALTSLATAEPKGASLTRAKRNLLQLLLLKARCQTSEDNQGAATLTFREAEELNLAPASVHLMRGFVLQERRGGGSGAASPTEMAREELVKALQLAEDDPHIRATATHLLANVDRQDKNAGDALARLREAQGYFLAAGNWAGEAQVMDTRGNVLRNLVDRPVMARKWFWRSLQLKKQIGDRYGASITAGNMSRLEFFNGNLTEAEEWAQENLSLSTDLVWAKGQAISHHMLAIIYRFQALETADPGPLRKQARKHLKLVDSVAPKGVTGNWSRFHSITGHVMLDVDEGGWKRTQSRVAQLRAMLKGEGLMPHAPAAVELWDVLSKKPTTPRAEYRTELLRIRETLQAHETDTSFEREKICDPELDSLK
jgi:tetratricopeptide (TPR) repeat protein